MSAPNPNTAIVAAHLLDLLDMFEEMLDTGQAPGESETSPN